MKIIGHQKIINLLDKAIVKKAVNHAYLFCGPEATGKFTVAMAFAEKLAGAGGRMNGDVIVVAPEAEEKKGIVKKKDIKIEQIRDLQHQLGLSASGQGYKVAIIDDADRLNKVAQNALLKTLEEATNKVVLILISQNEKRMLPTIVSRCQKIRFGTVPDAELKRSIPDGPNAEEVLFWSLGRPGLMLELMGDRKELDSRREALAELKKIFSQNAVDKFSLAENMSKDAGLADKKMNFWVLILREAMLGRGPEFPAAGGKTLRIIEMISKSQELLKETNSNARLILENLFLEF